MDSDFLTSLRTFDKDHIPAATVQKIRPFIANPEFEPNKVLTVRLVQQAAICRLLRAPSPNRRCIASTGACWYGWSGVLVGCHPG